MKSIQPCRPRSSKARENPLALISTAKLYEVQKYCSLTNHMWDGYWFLANRRAWEALPDDVRMVVEKNVNGAALNARADTEKLNATVREELASKGLTFNQPDVAPFREESSARPGSIPNGRENTATRRGRYWRNRSANCRNRRLKGR